ncbi:hypothetical protein SDC9_104317 [bioreactor metagenome]|uniref:Uncharacterized protein n=1 Tax=bioreactor metagenome TaxID=1076179 RepID=A0A645AW72_9ZZZZ
MEVVAQLILCLQNGRKNRPAIRSQQIVGAVGRSRLELQCSKAAARSGLVFHYHIAAKNGTQFVGEHAGDDVAIPAGRKTNDDSNRVGILSVRQRGAQAQQSRNQYL